jgi:LacI family transcriptional regulator
MVRYHPSHLLNTMVEKPTLEHIGRRAGVSTATVSRVINNHPNVKSELRKRVWQVIEEMEYRPNAAARSLAGQRSRILGLVIPESAQMLFTDPYFPRLIQGIAHSCKEQDYTLTLFLFDTVEGGAKLSPRLIQGSLLDGVILAGATIDDPLVDHLVDSGTPFVLVGRSDHPRVSFIDVDNEVGAYTGVTHMIRQGYEKIGTITGPLNVRVGQLRRDGYIRALQDRGRVIDETLMTDGDFTEGSGYTAMMRLLPRQPDAIFVASDTMALGAMRAIRQVGKNVPGDIVIVSFDDLPPAEIAEPRLTTVRQPVRRTGALAVEMLIDILEHGAEPARRLILPTELVIRESCGANP